MNNINDFEYVTSVNLNYRVCKIGKKEKPVYHFIYASQLYGTIFGIYGRFEGKEINIAKEKVYQIKKISLRLLNYKGYINIGFTKDDIVWDGYENLEFRVKGASTLVKKSFVFKRPINVKKGERFPIVFNRKLCPLSGFENYLGQRRGSIASRKLSSEPPISRLFDSEFNDRDGIDFYSRELKPGMVGYPDNEIASPRCIQSNVSLYF